MAQFTIALDKDGKTINIDNATQHMKYKCINCGEPMIVRKGEVREHHFAHYQDTQQCNHDDWLHKRIIDVLITRLENSEPLTVCSTNGKIDLSDNILFKKEKQYESWFPDILVKTSSEEVIFIEVCVSHPCSKDKINSGCKIIEIKAEDARAIEELESGTIHSSGEYYKLIFHNFHTDNFIPAPVSVNGTHANYFILHADGNYEITQHKKFSETDLLILGINTAENFAINIGKAYAWRKGFIGNYALTNYEIHIDMQAVIQTFNVSEYKIE